MGAVVVLGEIWEVVIPGTCACAAEGAIERVTGPAGGLGDQVAIQIDGGRDGPMSSQRETSEIGTPSASAVLVNVCRKSWKVVSAGNPAAMIAVFVDTDLALLQPRSRQADADPVIRQLICDASPPVDVRQV